MEMFPSDAGILAHNFILALINQTEGSHHQSTPLTSKKARTQGTN